MWDSIKKYLRGLDFFNKLAHLSLVFIAMVIAVLFYWVLRPYDVYTIDSPYDVTTHDIRPGEIIEVRQVYCKNIEADSTVTISLVDGYVEVVRVLKSNIPVGCYDRVSRSISVPRYTPPGEYKIRYTFEVRVNPIRTVVYSAETEPFNILPE